MARVRERGRRGHRAERAAGALRPGVAARDLDPGPGAQGGLRLRPGRAGLPLQHRAGGPPGHHRRVQGAALHRRQRAHLRVLRLDAADRARHRLQPQQRRGPRRGRARHVRPGAPPQDREPAPRWRCSPRTSRCCSTPSAGSSPRRRVRRRRCPASSRPTTSGPTAGTRSGWPRRSARTLRPRVRDVRRTGGPSTSPAPSRASRRSTSATRAAAHDLPAVGGALPRHAALRRRPHAVRGATSATRARAGITGAGLRVLDVSPGPGPGAEPEGARCCPRCAGTAPRSRRWPSRSPATGTSTSSRSTSSSTCSPFNGLTDLTHSPVGAARIIDVDDPRHPFVVSDVRLEGAPARPAQRPAEERPRSDASPRRGTPRTTARCRGGRTRTSPAAR